MRSTFGGNRAPQGYGGAIINTSVMTISNSTISGNMALWTASGVSNGFSGALLLYNITVTDNTCATGGDFMGGGCGVHHWGISVQVQNSLMAGNHDLGAGRPLSPDVSGSFTSLGHNVVGVAAGGFIDGVDGDQVGTASSPLDARLLALGRYGGPTATHLPQWGSPAIDAADASTCPATDQRGVARPLGASCDAGAVEFGVPSFVPVVLQE